MNGHTPTSWVLDGIGSDGTWEIWASSEDDSHTKIICVSNPYERDAAESHANGRLIAAAPALLVALRGCLAQCIARHDTEGSTQEQFLEIARAQAAIHKAEGEPS